MQYLLSQDELDELRARARRAPKLDDKQLQDLCSLIADGWIVEDGWYKGKAWGCIITTRKRDWYCDECVMREICPNPNKEWSK